MEDLKFISARKGINQKTFHKGLICHVDGKQRFVSVDDVKKMLINLDKQSQEELACLLMEQLGKV